MPDGLRIAKHGAAVHYRGPPDGDAVQPGKMADHPHGKAQSNNEPRDAQHHGDTAGMFGALLHSRVKQHDDKNEQHHHRARINNDLHGSHELRAQATYLSGEETNALMLFTNFIAHFQSSVLAPRAQLWVADYYYRTGNPVEAERNYQLLYRSTNWPPSELTYQAQLSAGLAAAAHQGWGVAKSYFTNLYNNTNCSTDLRVQALFEYGKTLMLVADPAETNKLANCEMATLVFGRICDEYPTNRVAIPAWNEKAKCYLQWALVRQQYDSLTNAMNAYQHVIEAPHADVAARSEAKVGQATVLVKWAAHNKARVRA